MQLKKEQLTMNLIYWNTNKGTDFGPILDICITESPDIIFLSEIKDETIDLAKKELSKINYEQIKNPGCDRVKIISKKGIQLTLSIQNKYYTSLFSPILNLNIISVHLPSQMFQHLKALKAFIRNFREEIDQNLGTSEEESILIIGDFNVNPFDEAMIDFDGFSATNSVIARKKITNLKKTKELYYNPTWGLYSNNDFPGTKYFKRPSGSSYDILEHHFLDQVVISRKLLNRLTSQTIKTINKSNNYIFREEGKNLIQESDHLPLSYTLKF